MKMYVFGAIALLTSHPLVFASDAKTEAAEAKEEKAIEKEAGNDLQAVIKKMQKKGRESLAMIQSWPKKAPSDPKEIRHLCRKYLIAEAFTVAFAEKMVDLKKLSQSKFDESKEKTDAEVEMVFQKTEAALKKLKTPKSDIQKDMQKLRKFRAKKLEKYREDVGDIHVSE